MDKQFYEIPDFQLFGRKLFIEADPAAKGCDDSFIKEHNEKYAQIASNVLKQMVKALTERIPKE